jgi:hypothetical protein
MADAARVAVPDRSYSGADGDIFLAIELRAMDHVRRDLGVVVDREYRE